VSDTEALGNEAMLRYGDHTRLIDELEELKRRLDAGEDVMSGRIMGKPFGDLTSDELVRIAQAIQEAVRVRPHLESSAADEMNS
jgi:hypothetical protein